jgi:predicted TIM-barrel fold metal-dependent hydrolase
MTSVPTGLFTDISRRQFLTGLAAAGAGALVSGSISPVQGRAQNPRRIDVHHHLISPSWKKQLTRWHAVRPVQGYETHQSYDPIKDIEAMDKGGVETSFLSVTTPGMWFGDIDETRRVVREQNEYGAQLVRDHKGRFGHFATVPLPDVDASLREIAYAFDTLKVDGISFVTSYADRWLGDKTFAPMWEELNRRKAVVYTHATAPNCCMWNFQEGAGGPIPLEFNSDLARSIASIISSGIAAKTPDVTYIWSHGGGSIWAQRYINANDLAQPNDPKSKMYHLRRFYYDTAAASDALHMGILKLAVPMTQILFGTDYPWGNSPNIVAGLEKCNLTAQEMRGIDRENALRIFPKLPR